MFGADGGVIEASGDGMGQFDLPFLVREQESLCSLQHAKPSALKTRGVFAALNSFAARFDANHPHISILQKRMKQADRVAASANAGNQYVGQWFFPFENLPAS